MGFESTKSHDGGKLDDNAFYEENRGKLYSWMRKVIKITKPKVFIAENVKGLISLGNVRKTIEDDFRNIDEGYIVVSKVLHAADFGVPQSRERIIFIGLNKRYLNKDFEINETNIFPEETHFNNNQKDKKSNYDLFDMDNYLVPYVSTKDVLLDLNEPEVETEDLSQMKYSKAKYYGKMQGNTEINLNSIGPTIRAEHHGNIEFRRLAKEHGGKYLAELNSGMKERRLTIRECARIQTFPDDYEFVRTQPKEFSLSASAAYKVIGNAVPPLLAYHIAMKLESIWNELFIQ
jgi:DNA (cytosine-5)-methyltransferase 1